MFSLKRFLNLFYYDFICNRKFYILLTIKTFGIIFTSCLAIKTYSPISLFSTLQNIAPKFFLIPLIISLLSMFDHYKLIHDPLKNIFYLSTPVSTFEHYIFNLMKYFFILPSVLIFFYYVGFNSFLLLNNLLLFGSSGVYLKLKVLSDFFINRYVYFLIICPFFLFCRIYFKTYPFIKMSLSFLIFSFFFFLSSIFFDKYSLCQSDQKFFFDYLILKNLFRLFSVLGFFLCLASYFKIEEFGSIRKKGNLTVIIGILLFFLNIIYLFLTEGSSYCIYT